MTSERGQECSDGKHAARVTVIIVNWNGRAMLADCLEAIKKQTFRRFETVVVDNGSSDDSVDYISAYHPDVRLVLLEQNLGFAKANNMAIKKSRSEYLALINNDACAHPDGLGNLVDALEGNPEAGSAASKMVYAEHPEIIDRAGDGYSLAGAGILRGRGEGANRYSKPENVFGACAGAALYRREMLTDIGLFDEDFFLIYEDIDLSFRAQLAGYKCIYVPDARVYHRSSYSIGNDTDTSIYFGHRNLEWVFVQNMPGKLIPQTLGPHFLYIILSFFFFFLKGRSKPYIKAKIDAWKGLRKALEKRKQVQIDRKADCKYIRELMSSENYLFRLKRRLKMNIKMKS